MSNTKSAESTLSEPIFNRQALVRLILPLLAEQFLSVSMGMADTLMVSGVGEAAVSSVSLVDSLNILIIQILSALATGGAVISSQYLGRRDGEKAAKSAAQLYTVLAVSTIAVMLVILVLSRPILRIVFGRIDDDVMRFSQTYFLISAISYPFIGFYNAGAALFRAQGNSRISMLASLSSISASTPCSFMGWAWGYWALRWPPCWGACLPRRGCSGSSSKLKTRSASAILRI